MRLICPNCDAQYEVADDVVPHDGRDVQCSNCGQTWFQHHPDHMPQVEEDPEVLDDLTTTDDTPAPQEERVAIPPEPQRRELDASVTDILRQEAALEEQARANNNAGLESQPELGLEASENDIERHARERTARMRGEDDTETATEVAATAAALGSRRDLLPDIEEINSTLRSTSDRQSGTRSPETTDSAAGTDASKRKSGGFRRGFMLMVLLALILVAIYVFAPQIARAVPQVDPYLSGYVAHVDNLRLWLDGQIASLLTWLDALASAQDQ